MITSIEKIIDFGIYKNYQKKNSVENFTKYNLIYGWNGSGKSTLSKLFARLRNDSKNTEFKNCQYEVVLDNGIKINQDTQSTDLRLSVFNSSFISDNIDWNDTLKSILLISEEKIDEQKRLREYFLKRDEIVKSKQEIQNNANDLDKEIKGFLSNTAKHIKEHFQIIDTMDKYYLNYNRTRLEKFIELHSKELLQDESILSQEKLIKVTKSIKPETKEKIDFIYKNMDIKKLNEAEKRIKSIVETKILTQTIQKLKNDKIISNWVEKGLEIHAHSTSKTCEFCGQIIPTSRIDDLERHFNNEYQEFKQKLISARDWVKQQVIVDYNDSKIFFSLYEEYQDSYQQSKTILDRKTFLINKIYENWLEILDKKIQNPFESIPLLDFIIIDEGIIEQFNEQISVINELISFHNNKCDNYQTETKQQKFLLEVHYTSNAIKDFEYSTKVNKFIGLNEEVVKQQKEIKKIDDKIYSIEKELSNEILGAEEFNKQLQMFIGHNEISLIFDKDKKGYKIIRTKTNRIAKNLSEGEKTALAFVYFVTKLKENGNDISNQIIVIDDPISSFDSNNLFSAYSFLKAHCQEAKQLFILTHNFVFFKLLRDWLLGKNKKDKIKSRCYSIESIVVGDERASYINNAKDTLTKYNSEYHYLFHKVYSFKRNEELTLDEAFLVSNLSRKLLEGFLSFKFPKKRNKFNQLFEVAVKDVQKRERIYKFINKYSHNATIEFSDNTIDNLLGESRNIVGEILDLIKELDEVHYMEMESIILENL